MKALALIALLLMSGCTSWRPWADKAIEIKKTNDQRRADERAAVEAERIAAEQSERERIEAEKQAAREAKAKQDAIDAAVIKVPVLIDYSKAWTLTLTGDFRASGHDRYFQSGKTLRDGIDCWNWNGRIAFRLFNEQINFTSAEVGTLSSPKPPDHWAYSVPFKNLARWSGVLRIEYDPAGSCRMYRDGTLVGSWAFKLIKMPAVRHELWLRGFTGEVVVE